MITIDGMHAILCRRCNHIWHTDIHKRERFAIITRYCPNCIEQKGGVLHGCA